MKLDNSFRVELPVDQAWNLLTDLPRIAPCLPGAHLDDVVDGEYRGGLSTKIGPINARYTGTARFLELDDVGRRAVIEARGREQKGSGAASATIVAVLRPDERGTAVDVSTELSVSGRAAQFGRSLLAEVSETMLAEFTRRLAESISSPGRVQPGTAESRIAHEENQLDVFSTVALPLLRRASVPGLVAVLAGLLGWVIGRSHPRERSSQ